MKDIERAKSPSSGEVVKFDPEEVLGSPEALRLKRIGFEGDRERERDLRERERKRGKERKREIEKKKQRERERQKERETERHRGPTSGTESGTGVRTGGACMCGRQYCRDVGGLARVRPASGLGGRLGCLRSDRLQNPPTTEEGSAHVSRAPASPGLRLYALVF